jgi:uncharacterized protein YggE
MKSDKSLNWKIGLLTMALLALPLLFVACAPTSSGAVGEVEASQLEQQGTIKVVGTGEALGQPDEVNVTVGVDTFAKVVNDATSENENTIQAILTALNEHGIASDDIQTTNYSLWAEQLYGDNGPEGIAGYRVSNQVNVKIRDIDKVGDVLTAAISAGANSIYGVNFSVADPAALEAEAREAAMANAIERAQSLAKLSGLELGDIQAIDEINTQIPFPMGGIGGGGGGAADTSISPGQLSYQVQVQVTFNVLK